MTDRCPHCGYPLDLVQVHGHGQCRTCGVNVEPCCQGAPEACASASATQRIDAGGDPRRSRVS